MMGLAPPLAVVAHDAGAANHILAWLEDVPEADVRPVMAGPAAALWSRRFPDRALAPSLEAAMAGAGGVLTGTGWASDLEHRARRLAAQAHIRCAAVIDHWTNYRMRFERGGEIVLPDEIWVTDADAGRLARQAFPGLPVAVRPNRYLERELESISSLPQARGILFVGEPAHDTWGKDEPGEFQAFRLFMDMRNALAVPPDLPVSLRPHPSDPEGKYDALLAAWPEARLDRSAGLHQAIAAAHVVAGLHSYAMAIALAAGRRVVSCLPPWGPPCALPQKGIVHLRDMMPR